MKKIIKTILISNFIMIAAVNTFGQLNGPSTAVIGQTTRYTYLAAGVLILPNWQITKGTNVASTQTGLYYFVDVNWNSVGSGIVSIYDGKILKASISVNILPAPPTVNSAMRCGPGTLSLSAATGSGGSTVRWYLAASGGAYFFQGNAWTTPSLSATTTYYLTTYSSAGESSPRTPIYATINPIVTTTPVVSGYGRFGPGTLSLSATGAPTGATYNWFNSSGQLLSSGNGFTTPVISSSMNNYMSVRIVSGVGCQGPAVSVNILIEPLPEIKSNGNRLVLGSPVLLESAADYQTYSWKNSSGATLSTSKTFNAQVAGNYTLTVSKTIFGTGVSVPFRVYDQFENLPNNFIAENIIQCESIQDTALISKLTISKNFQTVDYMDGLGRMIQRVSTRHSPLQKDLVQVKRYDNFGRETKVYLPFTAEQTGLIKEQVIDTVSGDFTGRAQEFYTGPSPDAVVNDSKPFSENLFDGHPSGKISGNIGPGQAWFSAGRGSYRLFEPNANGKQSGQEQIIAWRLSEQGSVPVRNRIQSSSLNEGFYLSGTLMVESAKNEQGFETRNYFNRQGRLVLRKVQVKEAVSSLNDSIQWAQTYFVYDDFGRLRYVLQPELVKNLVKTNSDPLPTQLANLAFIYRYDGRGREIVKKMPGADSIFQVYDLRDRLVMRQNASQRILNQWEFFKYDELNRIIIRGIYTHPNNISQSEMTALVSQTKFFEYYVGTTVNHGYSNNVFPTDGIEIQEIRYYDDYQFRNLWTSTFNYFNEGLTSTPYGATYSQIINPSVYLRSQITGIKTRILGSGEFVRKIFYYDMKDKLCQIISDVFINGVIAGVERTSMLYDFTGKLLKSRTVHRPGLVDQRVVNKRFEYDFAGRLINSWLQLDSRPEVLIRQNNWNELDQLVDLKLHSTDNGITFRQSIDYRYNIRGWINSINNSGLTADGITNDDQGDYFGLNIFYEYGDPYLKNRPDFSGNISAVRWSSNLGKSSEKERAYRFFYDPMDRLKSSEFLTNSLGWVTNASNQEDGMDYDLNGNLLALRRTDENGLSIDQLRYIYGSGNGYGNKLVSIQDSADPQAGFNDSPAATDYFYNAIGNLTADRNSKMSVFEYNNLDLPSLLISEDGSRQKNIFDAGGTKLRSEYYSASGQLIKSIDFTGELIYEQGVLNRFEHEDGRILYNNYRYQYFIKDHLNNVRITFDVDPETKNALATFEQAAALSEQTQFLRLNAIKKVYSTLLDRTNGSSSGYSVRLSGALNERYGPAKSLQVFPGDEFRAEVYVKYLEKNQSIWTTALKTLVGQIVSGTSSVVQEGSSFSTSTSSFPFSGLLSSPVTDVAPSAYLNWLVFDKNYKFIPASSGFVRVSTAAREYGQDVPFEKLASPLIKISEPGYVYIYLSNEETQPVEVYFDDFAVNHTRSPIVQMNDYYPMGNTFNTFERDDVQEQNLKFNSKSVEKFFNLNWADLGRRNYALTSGRFFLQDRFQEKYFHLSPYQYAANNPLKFADYQGDSIIQVTIRDHSGYIRGEHKVFIDHLILDDLKTVLNDAIETGTYIHLNSSFRTLAKQKELLSDGKAKIPAQPGKSSHNAGLAIDFNVFVNNDPEQGLEMGNKSLNADNAFIARVKERQWRFGGDFKTPDKIHLDKRGSVMNFNELVRSNQHQVDGYRMLQVPEERIKRKEIIELNSN